VNERIALERRVRELAPAGDRGAIADAVRDARAAGDRIQARQVDRREEARDQAGDDSRRALLIAIAAGVLALVGALGLIGALISQIRRPLDALVGATRRFAGGDLGERVEPAGPQELRDLGGAFNTMAAQLGGAQRRIEAERAKLAVTIESLGDALVVCDADGIVSAVNPRAEEVVPSLRPGTRADSEEGPLPPLDQALQSEVMTEHGDRTVAITASRLGSDEGEGVVWTIRDVSERARVERAKSDFVATASHELRSPLTSIKGFVELLARSDHLQSRDREFVDVILRSTDRLVDLVGDLLDVARLEAGKMEVRPRPVDVGEVVREAAELLRPRIEEKRQVLDLDLPDGLPRALADPGRTRQIVINLLSNAHQYTGEGGRLAIAVRASGAMIELAVADSGRGMTREEVERAFERFSRRDEGPGGTGLGLAIVRSLTELQHGEVEVESEPGRGSVFTVRLPMTADADADGDGAAARAAIRGKRVLVVDDEPDTARLIATQLEPYGVAAVIVHSGEEAIDRLREEHFDAVTLDILMPGMGGFEVLRVLRGDPDLRRTPVVVVSIFSGTRALFGEWKVGKPVDAEELADALGSAVAAGRTRVLVVGRASVRERLEPALERLGLEHEWVTSAAAAGRACADSRFEVALVDAGMRDPQAAVRELDLRGRRLGRAVVLFTTGDDAPGVARIGADLVAVEEAADAVLATLTQATN
jgi:signal transduction histidine kinase/CheY-like chemotaxis protein